MRQQLDVVSGLEIHKATLLFMDDGVNDLTFLLFKLLCLRKMRNLK